jgi:hypothetical protein
MALNALHIHSHKTQLILAAITASLATATLITAYSTYTRRANRRALGEEVSKALAKASADEDLTSDTQNTDYDEGLIREQLARNYAFFGEEAMTKIRKGSVVVVGCGGVGSWAAVMLVRSYVCIDNAYNKKNSDGYAPEACQRSGWWTLTTSLYPRSTGTLQLV